MSKEEPAWKAELRENLDEEFISSGAEIFDLVVPYITAAEQRGFQAGVNKTGDSVGKLREQLKTAEEQLIRVAAKRVEDLKADWSRYRGTVLQEAWEAMRDAEGGPLIDAMSVINFLLDTP